MNSASRISVRFFTTLREVTGKKEDTVVFKASESATVNDALSKLAKRHGKVFSDYTFDPRTGEPKGFLQFLVNGRSTFDSGGLKTRLRNGDVLAIIPPVGGG